MDKTFRTTHIEFKNVPTLELEDLSQECYAYMKTKQFMAQRIFEQQDEIESIKSQLFYHTIKHVQMYDWLKFVNQQLQQIKLKKEAENTVKVDLDVSEDLAHSFVYEQAQNERTPIPEKKTIPKTLSNLSLKDTEVDYLKQTINTLKNENLDLRRENEMLRVESLEKNLTMTKLRSEKFILFNELNELTKSLKMVDQRLLNKFYKSHTSHLKLDKSFMPSSLGLKYNIVSVQNQLSYLMHSDLISNKNFSEYVLKAKDTFAKEKAKIGLNIGDEQEVNYENDNFIDLEKYVNVVKKFEKEFDRICEKNGRRMDWRD